MSQMILCAQFFATTWTLAHQAPLSMGFLRQEYWNGLPFPIPGNLPNLGTEFMSLVSPALQADSLSAEPSGKSLFKPCKGSLVLSMSSSWPPWPWLTWFPSVPAHLSNLLPSLPLPYCRSTFLPQGHHPALLETWNGSPGPVVDSVNFLSICLNRALSKPSPLLYYFFLDDIITIYCFI